VSEQRDRLAEMAVGYVRDGMVVGLGTGRAASRGIRALAARVQREGLKLTCVSSSVASAQLGSSLGLKVVDFASVDRVDFVFDGADEVTIDRAMLKGGGGAMTRERLLAQATEPGTSQRPNRVYMVDASKVVDRLCTRMPLPVEFVPFAAGLVRRELQKIGLTPILRLAGDDSGRPMVTDNGLHIYDCRPDWSVIEPAAKAKRLLPEMAMLFPLERMPGVVDHGLFLFEADVVLVEPAAGQDGDIEVMGADVDDAR
jgi:ribose 5-phosphate isomerase A